MLLVAGRGTGQLLAQSRRNNGLIGQIRRRQVGLAPAAAQAAHQLLRHAEGAAGRRSWLEGGRSLLIGDWLLL